jgi:peptidoglycan/xylan/chitin deacetylase (PgdA/CDA1 family)
VEHLLAAVDRYAPRMPGWLPILMYHRVAELASPPRFDPMLLSAAPEVFEEEVRLLAQEFTPISVELLLDVRAGRGTLPRRAVLVTFDDAYTDFAEHAWPVLRKYGVPVTLFVPTAYPDSPDQEFWWDRVHRAFLETRRADVRTPAGELPLASAEDRVTASRSVCEHVKTMTHAAAMDFVEEVIAELGGTEPRHDILGWEDLRRLSREGVTVAPHSRSHAMLDKLPPDRLVDEIVGSRRDIEDAIGSCLPVFCYPAGQWSPYVEHALQRASYEIAVTTEIGANRLGDVEWLALKRIRVSGAVTSVVLRGLLLPSARGVLRLF